MGEKMRIYVGGLGSSVREDDLKKTFGSPHLGTVESVEINRNKGRSFGYMEFVPASDKALAKLFSAYNGCMWKGGRLKLEKAKEHYLSRLGREWIEDAELAAKLANPNVDADESVHTLQKFKEDRDVENHIRIFFPKLRRIKPLPLKGSGKHKYSFQRVEVPPLPIHFCDCEEHSGPPDSAKRNNTNEHDKETSGVDDEELNIMKMVLNKLLEKENCSNNFSNGNEFTKEMKLPLTSVDNFQINDNAENQVSGDGGDDDDDDDDVVINLARPSNRGAPFEDWGQFKTAANQGSLLGDVEPSGRSQKRKPLPDKKRKAFPQEHDRDDTVASKKKVKVGSSDVPVSKKSAWTNLVKEKGSTAFHISDILTDSNTESEASSISAAPSSNKTDSQNDQSNKNMELEKFSDVQISKLSAGDDKELEDKIVEGDRQDDQSNIKRELEMVSDVQSNKPSAVEDDKSGRGASWLQKSSWIQLVGDSNKSSFSLGQILPGVTFEKQEIQQIESIDFSGSNRNGKQLQEEANKDIYDTAKSPVVDALIAEQNHADLEGDKLNSSDTKSRAEHKDDGAASVPRSNSVLKNRASVEQIVISETCPFMRSADSLKVWAKTKAALSVSLKKKGKVKGTNVD